MKKCYLVLFIMIAVSTATVAQDSATASSSATIVAPIAIAKSVDMSFGNVAVSTTAGTVVLAPAGTRTTTGGVTLPGTTGTVTAAAFSVTGEAGYTYAITLPASAITLSDTATTPNTMTVGTFTSTPSATGTLTAGAETVNVGATLNVGASQVAGTYTNTTDLTVTVNYN